MAPAGVSTERSVERAPLPRQCVVPSSGRRSTRRALARDSAQQTTRERSRLPSAAVMRACGVSKPCAGALCVRPAMAASCVAALACPPRMCSAACRTAAARAPLAETRSALRFKGSSSWCPSGAQLLHARTRQRSGATRRLVHASASLLLSNDAWTVWSVLLSVSALGIWCVCPAAWP